MQTAIRKHEITVRTVTPDDADAFQRILDDHADVLSLERRVGWRWPSAESQGFAAVDGSGRVVAFIAMRMTEFGIFVDDLWEERSREGLRGLAKLADLAEGWAEHYGVDLGGIIELKNRRHIEALARRGYEPIAVVMSKKGSHHGRIRKPR